VWYPDERDPLDDPEEAATLTRMFTRMEGRAIGVPSDLGDWDVMFAPGVIDGSGSLLAICHASSIERDLLIDLSRTSLLTAGGARALNDIHLGKELRGRMLLLQAPSPFVRQIMGIVGLDRTIAMLSTN